MTAPLIGRSGRQDPLDGVRTADRIPGWKRALDLALGTVALVSLSPVMLAAALCVAISSRGPVLFRQTRIGRNERPFVMLKFRTMHQETAAADDDLEQIARELDGTARPDPKTELFRPADDPRVTPVGRWLRRLSLDELPQLFNVLRGEMSLVGPRPALPGEVAMFTPAQRRRHTCLPGMTGLWQVAGRNRLNSTEMLNLDLAYVDVCSLRTDLRILAMTPWAVLVQRNTG